MEDNEGILQRLAALEQKLENLETAEQYMVSRLCVGGMSASPVQGCADFAEISTPATPNSGFVRLYGGDNLMRFVNDPGVMVPACVAFLTLPIFGFYMSGAAISNPTSYIAGIAYRDGVYDWIHGVIKLPHGWAGRTMRCMLAWAPTTAGAGVVRWVFEMMRVRNGAALPTTATGTAVIDSTAPGVANQAVTGAVNYSLSGYNEGDYLHIRIVRYGPAAQDTYAATATLVGAGLTVV